MFYTQAAGNRFRFWADPIQDSIGDGSPSDHCVISGATPLQSNTTATGSGSGQSGNGSSTDSSLYIIQPDFIKDTKCYEAAEHQGLGLQASSFRLEDTTTSSECDVTARL